jgi:hypothetical protein
MDFKMISWWAMTLTTHAVVGTAAMGAAVAVFGPTPAGLTLGCAAGFASHFIIDCIPHWHEGKVLLRSATYDKNKPLEFDVIRGKDALRDLAIVSTDGLLGLALSIFVFSVWLFQIPLPFVFLGAAAGDLPDALQFVYIKTHLALMEPLQLFHDRIQDERLDTRFLLIELLLMVVAVGVLKLFF